MTIKLPPGYDHTLNGRRRPPQPNIIWVFGDQHRAQALGCNGDPNVKTPNIDNLAAMGVNCTRAVGGFPLCCPCRGSLITSHYPHHCVPGHQYQLPPEQATVADAFNEAGYHTGYFGKWHLDGGKEIDGRMAFHFVPPERRARFQEWVGYENNNDPWNCWVHGGEGDDAFQRRLDGYETDSLTDLLIDYVERQHAAERPFFGVLSVQPPHDPMVAPERFRRLSANDIELPPNVPPGSKAEWKGKREAAGYYGAIENLDWNLGRVMDTLRRLGIEDKTYVIFFSDHGEMLGSHGLERKVNPHEESIRVPFIVGAWGNYSGPAGVELPLPINTWMSRPLPLA